MSERKRKRQKTTQFEQITAGTIIRMEKAKSSRKPKTNSVLVVAQEVNPVTGFTKFIKDYGVIGVAVGFAIASQSQVLIKSLIDNMITPLYTLLFNTGDPKSQVFTMNFRDHPAQELKWGLFLTQFINFLFVLAAIYAIVKILGLDKLGKKDEDEKEKDKK